MFSKSAHWNDNLCLRIGEFNVQNILKFFEFKEVELDLLTEHNRSSSFKIDCKLSASDSRISSNILSRVRWLLKSYVGQGFFIRSQKVLLLHNVLGCLFFLLREESGLFISPISKFLFIGHVLSLKCFMNFSATYKNS